MKILNAFLLMTMFVFASCAALEDHDRSPAAKKAHKSFLNKQEYTKHYWRFDRGFDR